MNGPPGLMPGYRMGGSASPSTNELVNAARLILDNCGIKFSTNKIVRLVVRFSRSMPQASGYAFFLYLTNAVQMSEAQKASALSNPDVARCIAYADPTGESAVNNVLRQARHG
ncbi:hypothetical protein [Mycolicibacterium austroafricanum]|uniref:hypothetical protein n=1 Tax=Mycolicibacterium austroafricanum TaxID=39687 RepID=UPI001CA34A5F|nr:hypothetical protein [Mycolicibacterium austroafricanum]QZT65867.1 hypothetical protein JN085_20215 [Mycolicibacterium austroafricanum]